MSLRIVSIDEMPIAEIRYLNAAPGGGTGVERLPITIARTTRLGEELDAIVICSDLQGIVRGRDDATELCGVHEDGEDGDLIRKYLVGVLGVRLEMPMGAVRYKLRLHLFHAQENQDELANAFLPVPQTVLRPNGARMDLIRIGERSGAGPRDRASDREEGGDGTVSARDLR